MVLYKIYDIKCVIKILRTEMKFINVMLRLRWSTKNQRYIGLSVTLKHETLILSISKPSFSPVTMGTLIHTVKSNVLRMNTPVSFSTWVHAIFSCLWTVLLFLTWLHTRFWLYMMQKHTYCNKHILSLQTRPVIHSATIYDRLSLTYESKMTILLSTLNRIESRRFISDKICAELHI